MNKTAILFFARTPKKEALVKKFFNNHTLAEKTASYLWNYHFELFHKTGLDVFWSNEETQRGTSFGKKIYNAFVDVFEEGYDNVIVFPADIPGLTLQKLEWYIQKLNKVDVVLAPDQRGGIAFFGLSKTSFDNLSFDELPWRTNKLFTTFIDKIKEIGHRFFAYSKLYDINNGKELVRMIISKLLPKLFLLYIQSLILRWIPYNNIIKGIQLLIAYYASKSPPKFA